MSETHYCLGFLFSKSLDRVVLIKKNKPAWQAGKLNGVGGKVEDSESSHDAMVREFKEEAGLHVPEWARICAIKFNPHLEDRATVHVFAAVGDWLTQVPVRQCPEGKVSWIFWNDEIKLPIMENLKWMIPLCRVHLLPGHREIFHLITPTA